MVTSATQIRIDSKIKKEANEIFSNLGLDMSGAVNIFLRQCILHGGLPFSVSIPHYNKEILDAMDEAIKIARDPSVKSYNSMEELRAELESDDL